MKRNMGISQSVFFCHSGVDVRHSTRRAVGGNYAADKCVLNGIPQFLGQTARVLKSVDCNDNNSFCLAEQPVTADSQDSG